MVERAVCGTGEETNAGRSVSRAVEPTVGRDENFEAAEAARSPEKLENYRVSPDSEIVKVTESSRPEATRESVVSGIATGTGIRFSLFKWFKRGSRDSGSSWDRPRKHWNKGKQPQNESSDFEENEITSDLSSNESVETLYSTATVRSFAFQTGTLGSNDNDDESRRHFEKPLSRNFENSKTRSVGPFGVGASKIIVTNLNATGIDVTKTLPANALSKRRDITARYSLQSCNGSTGGFGSCGNFIGQRDSLVESPRGPSDRSARVHVRGKRRAPDPPLAVKRAINIEQGAKITTNKGRRKRRQAPKPPDVNFTKPRVLPDFTNREETGSVNLSAKEEIAETGSAILIAREKTACERLLDKEETGGANLPAREETGSASLSAKKESANLRSRGKAASANLSEKEETGSAKLRAKEQTEGESLRAEEETGSTSLSAQEESANLRSRGKAASANFSTKEETGSAKLRAKEQTEGESLRAEEETGSASLWAKKESANLRSRGKAASANFSTKEETGSAKLRTKEQTEGESLRAEEETGSASLWAKKESANLRSRGKAASANLSKKEETGSVKLRVKEQTEGESLRAEEETGSASLWAKEESANLRSRGKAASANLLTKEETGSAKLRTKEQTEGESLRAEEETGSARGKAAIDKGKIKSANLSVKHQSGSAKGMNVGESGRENKVTEKLTRIENKRVSTSERFYSNRSEEQTTPTTEGSQNHSTARDHEKDVGEKVKRENGNFSRATRNVDDVTSLLTETTGNKSTFVTENRQDLDFSGSISNDSLVLQGGILHSKRETHASLTSSLVTSSSSSSTRDEVETSLARSKGRIAVTTGSQTSTASAMPRPWYKRSVFEHSRDSPGTTSPRRGDVLRNPGQPEVREDPVNATIPPSSLAKYRQSEKNQDGGTLSRLNFFHRSENKNVDERKKQQQQETKRRSGLSMLANISELDKEAAAIVQEEQARTRAASMLLRASRSADENIRNDETEDVVQEIVSSAMETSPRRGTRALISKFNAIGNITKVTVNASFFAKNSHPRDSRVEKNDVTKNSSENEWRESVKLSKSQNVRVDKDLSRYFLPAQKTSRDKKIDDLGESSGQITSRKTDVTSRLSFFQGISGDGKKIEPEIREDSLQNKISHLSDEIIGKSDKKSSFDNSPKFSRLRVNVPSGVKSTREECQERTKKIIVNDVIKREADVDEKNRQVAQKEFSSVLREIDDKLFSDQYHDENREKLSKKLETSSASQVSRVLDILVEAEKNDRQKSEIVNARSNGESEFFDNFEKRERSKLFDNPAKTDLREMLKEMKHSLPKRPKPKKNFNQDIFTINNEEKSLNDGTKKKDTSSMDDRRKEFFLSDNEKLPLLSPVKVAYPPPIRIGPPCKEEAAKRIFRVNEDRDYDRQKVSSAAQTSGNLRKVDAQSGLVRAAKSSKWRNEDVVYRTSGKGVATPGTSGLTKNTFQLIRPREFAQIEAIKTMKNSNSKNTYANVVEQSLYANVALTPATRKNYSEISRNREIGGGSLEEQKLRDPGSETIEMEAREAPDSRVVEAQNMNTLDVNRLLRKLEAAIASGHHQQAAGLAKELARLKIHCSVVRQRTKAKDIVNVNMYIEDKLAHQGPMPLRLARSMTVAQLKAKVFTEFEIPTNVQRWIVGKNLAEDDSTKLEELQAVEGSPVFLYLVAPELKNDETPLRGEKLPLTDQELPKDPEPGPIKEISKLVELDEPEEQPVETQTMKEEDDEECISEEVRMERYEALISLENCDVIPNSEPIECPICFVTYGPQEGVILRDCLHMFCRPCIANTIRYCEEAEVKCPFRDTEYTCESTLQEREIKALVEPEVYQQHLAKSIAQAENNAGNNAFHCKTPDCPGWCIYDDNVNNFLCPVCGVNNCLTCQVVHTGKNCRQYQEELRFSKETDQESKRTAAMLEEMVDRGEALPCPTCAVVLMKKWGCDWLRCSMCKTEICWVTRGPRWGPGGKGDTSGGCRCGEGGVKCHPRCNYCH